MEYEVIEARSIAVLEEKINELAQQGYEVKTHTTCGDTSNFGATWHTVIMEKSK